jgi:hypothetical protein
MPKEDKEEQAGTVRQSDRAAVHVEKREAVNGFA